MPTSPPKPATLFSAACRFGAWVIPLLVSLGRTSPVSQWRDDVAIVRGLGLEPVGIEGALSSLLMQTFSLVPVGGRLLRAGWVGALGAALAGYLIYSLALRLCGRDQQAPRLSSILALTAALITTLGAPWQVEASAAGGATLAAALVLVMLRIAERATEDARYLVGSGLLLAVTFFELRLAALASAVVLIATFIASLELPSRRGLALFTGALVFGVLCVWLPLHAASSDVGAQVGRSLFAASSTESQLSWFTAPVSWLSQLGILSCATALIGTLLGALRRASRLLTLAFLLLLVLDVAYAQPVVEGTSFEPRVVFRLLALASLATLSAAGLHALVLGLRDAGIYMARPVGALLVATSVAFAFVALETSSQASEGYRARAAEVWTDEALGSLPPESLLLVRSRAAAWRLWSAQVLRGEGPDIVVVPIPLLDQRSVATSLLQREPAIAPLVRELSLKGQPGEYALSSLADARPLYVEFDPEWDQRLLEHLSPNPFWMRFAPHALGRSDRVKSLAESRETVARVLEAARSGTAPDVSTLSMLGERVREQAIMLGALGDLKSVERLLEELSLVPSEQAMLPDLRAALDTRRGRTETLMALLP